MNAEHKREVLQRSLNETSKLEAVLDSSYIESLYYSVKIESEQAKALINLNRALEAIGSRMVVHPTKPLSITLLGCEEDMEDISNSIVEVMNGLLAE